MSAVEEVMIVQYCQKPKRFRIVGCMGGVIDRSGILQLDSMNAMVFEGDDGYEEAVKCIAKSSNLLLRED